MAGPFLSASLACVLVTRLNSNLPETIIRSGIAMIVHRVHRNLQVGIMDYLLKLKLHQNVS